MATYNCKFVQKWLTEVHVNSSVIYFIKYWLKMVLQAMPFLHKLAKRYGQP